MSRFAKPAVLASLLVILTGTLAGCNPSQGSQGKAAVHIVASVQDCAALNLITADDCQVAIEQAVVQHERAGPSYKTLALCEATEGEGNCERTSAGSYMPRPVAFHFTMSRPPVARPLYMGLKGAATLRVANGTAFSPDGDIPFSDWARRRVEAGVDKKKGKRSG